MTLLGADKYYFFSIRIASKKSEEKFQLKNNFRSMSFLYEKALARNAREMLY